jgi:hypothetical protein
MSAATVLRRVRASDEYALRPQSLSKQKKAAFSAGASYFVILASDFAQSRKIEVQPLLPVEGLHGEPLDDLIAKRPSTLDELLEVIRANPDVLPSVD